MLFSYVSGQQRISDNEKCQYINVIISNGPKIYYEVSNMLS